MHLQSAAQPRKRPVHDLLARAMGHHQKGELSQAEKYYKRALKAAPDHPDALHLSGLVAHQLGRHPRAIKLIRKAIKKDCNQKVFYINLSTIHNQLCNWEDARAAASSALELDEADGEAWGNLGQALAGLGQIDEALSAMGRSLALAPQNAPLLCNQATLLVAKEQHKQAETACRKALALQPGLPKALHTLGLIQSTCGDFDSAIGNFEQAHQGDPLNGQTITNLATLYSVKSRFDDAIALFRDALRVNPDAAGVHYNLGVCQSEKGVMDEALASFRRAVDIDPRHVDSQYALATSGKVRLPPEQLMFLAELAQSPDLSLENKVKLNFALGMQADQQKLPAPAITFFATGNACRRVLLESKNQGFNPRDHARIAAQISGVFQKPFFETRRGWGDATDKPVFVVGMPRSGTTLVEKILASHQDVFGAGERPNIETMVQELETERDGGLPFPEGVADLGPEDIASLAQDDLRSLSETGDSSARVVDKLPVNFMYLGLIALLYPGARVIHCKRDPRDTALSCYFQNFVHSHAWSCDLAHIGAYYKTYINVMEHWSRALPLPILDVSYEDVVQDQEGKSREMIDFIGLDWDPDCLDFHVSEGAVRTASKWQVRQPIYTGSVARWTDYDDFLSPFIQALS
ncbi:MAG: sulfotransferase [Rhodospirillales bacterium]|nr:sulfotransferase [Rhodospirillales bacterium]